MVSACCELSQSAMQLSVGRILLCSVRQRVEQAGVPSLAGLERHLEAEPAVRVHGFLRRLRRGDRRRHVEVAIAVRRTQLLRVLRPFGDDAAAADDAVRLHLEHVREVAAQNDLKLEADRLHAVVGDVEVFVHAAADRAAYGEAEVRGAIGPSSVRNRRFVRKMRCA